MALADQLVVDVKLRMSSDGRQMSFDEFCLTILKLHGRTTVGVRSSNFPLPMEMGSASTPGGREKSALCAMWEEMGYQM